MLPNQYIHAEGLCGSNCYFNTGINSSSGINIRALFYANPNSTATYLFGARNSAGTDSAGQLNFLQRGSDGSCYIGYAGARLEINEYIRFLTYIEKFGNQFTVLEENTSVFNKTGSTSTFNGTRPMFILALNNGGSVSYGSGGVTYPSTVYAFAIEDLNSVVQHNYVPCYDTVSEQFGLYDTAVSGGNFLTNQGTGTFDSMSLLEVQSGNGGNAYIRTQNAGNVTEQYRFNTVIKNHCPCVAVPNKGYEFLNWTDENDNVLSADEEFLPSISTDTIITANFVKQAEEDAECRYQLLGLEYGVSIDSATSPDGSLSNIYTFVKSFTCKEDALSRATTTIEVEEVPSLYQVNMPVFLISPRGKTLYCGVINSIKENTITCREPLSLFDSEMICIPSNSFNGDDLTNRSVIYGTWVYYFNSFYRGSNKSTANPFYFLVRLLTETFRGSDKEVYFDRNKNMYSCFPLIEGTNIVNVEDRLFELFDQFGITVESYIFKTSNSSYPQKGIKNQLAIYVKNPRSYETLTISDNVESVSNVQITEENQNNTCLLIYNSTGATFRGAFAMTNDGVLKQIEGDIQNIYNPSQYIAYNECKNKIVMSDDKVTTISEQELGNALYNHKITMEVDILNGIYRMEDFKLGRRVDFYYKGKLYKSVVTAKEFAKNDNVDKITSVKVTLGNVRTNLTTKLNIGKTKKK